MMDDSQQPSDAPQALDLEKPPKRKPYLPPLLEELGDLRDLTLGPSPGRNESGHEFTHRVRFRQIRIRQR